MDELEFNIQDLAKLFVLLWKKTTICKVFIIAVGPNPATNYQLTKVRLKRKENLLWNLECLVALKLVFRRVAAMVPFGEQ